MNLKIDNLTHGYDVNVFKDLRLEIDGYQAIGIIGVSGSGKSTLLRIMSGLEQPNHGTVEINGRSVKDSVYRKSVGFVFQNHSLFPHLSLMENITLILEKTRGFSKADASAAAEKNLARLQLLDQAHKLPKNVSGGQAQRASIARALAIDPDVVFLDEPTSSLDPILTHEVLSSIEDLKGIGKDFAFVTHVISFVHDFADYVLFMHQGKIEEQGPPNILDSPQTEALRTFMHKVR